MTYWSIISSLLLIPAPEQSSSMQIMNQTSSGAPSHTQEPAAWAGYWVARSAPQRNNGRPLAGGVTGACCWWHLIVFFVLEGGNTTPLQPAQCVCVSVDSRIAGPCSLLCIQLPVAACAVSSQHKQVVTASPHINIGWWQSQLWGGGSDLIIRIFLSARNSEQQSLKIGKSAMILRTMRTTTCRRIYSYGFCTPVTQRQVLIKINFQAPKTIQTNY